jgi:CrcB protein
VSAWVWLAVLAAGALGSVARVRLNSLLVRRIGAPWGIAAINVAGALALGVLLGAGATETSTVIVGAGLLGSFTTYSTWMVDTLLLARRGRRRVAAANVAGQVAAGLLAAGAGLALGAALAA